MLNDKVTELLNEQINKEFFSAYFYLDIYNYYTEHNLNGFASWFYVQTQEERDHATLFMKYLLNNSAKVKLTDISAANKAFSDFKAPLVATLEHELLVTQSIHNIYDVAYTNKDFRTMQFLDWFVKEQGEEEKNSDDLIKKYDLFGSDPKSLYLLDTELATRVYTPPTLVI